MSLTHIYTASLLGLAVFYLMTLVSFVRVAYETKKPRVSTRGRNSFSDKKLLSIY